MKVILIFFRHGEEGVFERHRSRTSLSCQKHHRLQDVKKHLTDFLGISEQPARKYGLGSYEVKLYRLAKSSLGKPENFVILTQSQWEMELPSLISNEGCSELNGKLFNFVFFYCASYEVV